MNVIAPAAATDLTVLQLAHVGAMVLDARKAVNKAFAEAVFDPNSDTLDQYEVLASIRSGVEQALSEVLAEMHTINPKCGTQTYCARVGGRVIKIMSAPGFMDVCEVPCI